jgi:hypothetical protein
MIGVTIATSKQGLLWPTEHWKTLIDSLCRGGAKHNPIHRYPLLAQCLAPLVCEHGGRFLPTAASRLAASDDTAITSLKIVRVKDGEDSMGFHIPELPDVEGWSCLDVTYFGTIGSRVQEAQTKSNVAALRARANELKRGAKSTSLWLHFRLSSDRRDRDLDNLADALMPLFNGWFPGLTEIHLSKGPPQPGEIERMWLDAPLTPVRLG